MTTLQSDGVLKISKIEHLGSNNADIFRDTVQAAMLPELKSIEVDFSEVHTVDSHGLGALLLVHRTACNRHGDVPLKLLNPQPSVQQILELTRMHQVFEIVKNPVRSGSNTP